jgi:hypothetical protein
VTLVYVQSPGREPVAAVGNRGLCGFPRSGGRGLGVHGSGSFHRPGALQLSTNDVVPFVEPSQQNPTEMNRPDAVVNLLEADGVLLQRVGNEEQPPLEPKGPGVRDALHDEMSGILDRR